MTSPRASSTFPAIEGIGGSILYLVDRYGDKGTIYDVDFDFFPTRPSSKRATPRTSPTSTTSPTM